MLNKTFISIESFYIPISRPCRGRDAPPIAITLPCNTVRIIFAAGLKRDKFNGYVGILSALGLFVRYVKFELGIKKANNIDRP